MTLSLQKTQRRLCAVFVSLFCGFGIAHSTTATISQDSRNDQSVSSSAPSIMVYEDGEDGHIIGWDAYDSDPAGATVTNVYDDEKGSNVIELSGAATANGYRLRNSNGSYWQNTAFKVIEWSMRYDEPFTVYILAQTRDGLRHISYTPAATSGLGAGSYIHHGLGATSQDGSWQTFIRDLEYDLKEAEPDNELQAVLAFLIRGSGRVDDIIARGTLPADLDSDGDGLSDIEEMTIFSTDPYQAGTENNVNTDNANHTQGYASDGIASFPTVTIYEDGEDDTGVAFSPSTVTPLNVAASGSVSYVYDRLGRLTEATYANGVVITYTYDAAGNRTNVLTTGVTALALAAPSSLSVAPAPTAGTDSAVVQSMTTTTKPCLVIPHQLQVEAEDPSVYGWNDSSDQLERMVTTVFESDGTGRLLHIQGYAIDTANTVGLWLNDTLLGYLSAGVDGAMSTPSLWLLPATLQVPGENTVTLLAGTEDQTWGVTRLGLYPMGSGLGNLEGLAGGDQSHAEGFELHLFSQGSLQSGYEIDLAGWDVNSSDEIGLELNTMPFNGLPQTDNQAWGPASRLSITPDLLLPGDNQLLINNRDGIHEPWGVRFEDILVEDANQVNDLLNEPTQTKNIE